MFDLRYHVTSLAAVFIALVIGILVGVALASHWLGNTARKILDDDLRRPPANDDPLTLRFGASKRSADGVIVVRSADPQMGQTAPFVKGLYEGVADAGVPAVGVARSTSDFSARTVFQQSQLSTVDDIDLAAGKLALAIVL